MCKSPSPSLVIIHEKSFSHLYYLWYFDSFLSSSLPICNFKAMLHIICNILIRPPSCLHVNTGPNSCVRFDWSVIFRQRLNSWKILFSSLFLCQTYNTYQDTNGSESMDIFLLIWRFLLLFTFIYVMFKFPTILILRCFALVYHRGLIRFFHLVL
jgi:hypothetical protein